MEAQLGIIVGVVGIVYAAVLYAWIKKRPDGTDQMREIAEMIHRGAMAFLRREYASLSVFVAVLFVKNVLADDESYHGAQVERWAENCKEIESEVWDALSAQPLMHLDDSVKEHNFENVLLLVPKSGFATGKKCKTSTMFVVCMDNLDGCQVIH